MFDNIRSFIENLYYELAKIGLEDVLSFISNLYTILLPFLIFYIILLIVCFFRLLQKEDKPGWYALIPLYNIYIFAKLVKIPFIFFFIPVLNLIVLFVMPYNLSREYGLKDWQGYIAILIPFIAIPYIAFSGLKNKNNLYKFKYLKFGKDIDNLDSKLKVYGNSNTVVDDNGYVINKEVKKYKPSKQAEMLDSMEFNADDNVYVDESEFIQAPPTMEVEKPEEKFEDEFIDIVDEDTPDKLTEIDELDTKLKEEDKENVNVNQDIKDYEKYGPSVNAIAFGGKQEYENQTEAKKEELKCPRCGSSLVGANGVCPGCGAKID